jgi:xylan 1,4-beta-xylosidase
MSFLCARPFEAELCCTLVRETGLQKMEWTRDGWLRIFGGGNLVSLETEESGLPDFRAKTPPSIDSFEEPQLLTGYYAPRIDPYTFADLGVRPGWLRLRGQESLSSTNRVSLLARKLTGLSCEITTCMEFHPERYQHSAGLVLYYDNMNYVWLRETFSESWNQPVLCVQEVDRGVKTDHMKDEIPVSCGKLWLRVNIEGKEFHFCYSADGECWKKIGPTFLTWHLSDEHSGYGEFTGTMYGLACIDGLFHRQYADFDYLEYRVFDEHEQFIKIKEE